MLAHKTDTLQEAFTGCVRAVLGLANFTGEETDIREIPLMRKMVAKMMNEEKLVFILPAFPAKSPSPMKTAGLLPDLGEVLALKNLNRMCGEISGHYAPGAEVIICSDGRIFSDVVSVPDDHITAYAAGIDQIISEFNLTHLRTFSMDEILPEKKGDDLRLEVLTKYGMSNDEVREKAKSNPSLFNGLHRFMIEDQMGISDLSKSQLNKVMKEKTYELMRRSDAWSLLLEEKFGDVLRLSIHPYPLKAEKFGVSLVPSASSSGWATPWHNVTVKTKDGYELMHKAKALALGATLKSFGGKYAYFEI